MLAATDWSCGTSGRVVEPPPGPVLRPEAVAEIAGFVQALGVAGETGPPIEIELVGAAGSGRTTLAAQAAARLGVRLVAVDAAALAARADAVDAAVREARRARLDGSVLAWENAEALPAELWRAIPAAPLTFLSVQAPAASPGGAAVPLDPALGPLRADRPARPAAAVVVAGGRARSRARSPSGRCGPPRSASPPASRPPASGRSVRSAGGS